MDIAVIIRAAGERTEALCLSLLQEQVALERVFVIREKPFGAAMAKCIDIALQENAAWTLCLDADVLFSSGAVRRLYDEAQQIDASAFGISCSVLDKFYGKRKKRGIHLYRTSLMERARAEYTQELRKAIRPETELKRAMECRGHPWVMSSNVYALHDFDQYYRDIFRKMATRAQKSPESFEYLIQRASRLAGDDADFLVAGWGLRFGYSLERSDIHLHANQWSDVIDMLLTCHGLAEKEPITLDAVAPDYVRQTIEASGIGEQRARLRYGIKHSCREVMVRIGRKVFRLR